MTGKVVKMMKSMHNLIMKNAKNFCPLEEMEDLSPMQGWILGYLYHNREKDVYQKTLETEFCIPKSTLATMLKQMCDKGYIIRESAEHDTRLKKISLSKKGCETQVKFVSNILKVEEYMCEGILEEEIQDFIHTGMKMKENLERQLIKRKGE